MNTLDILWFFGGGIMLTSENIDSHNDTVTRITVNCVVKPLPFPQGQNKAQRGTGSILGHTHCSQQRQSKNKVHNLYLLQNYPL